MRKALSEIYLVDLDVRSILVDGVEEVHEEHNSRAHRRGVHCKNRRRSARGSPPSAARKEGDSLHQCEVVILNSSKLDSMMDVAACTHCSVE